LCFIANGLINKRLIKLHFCEFDYDLNKSIQERAIYDYNNDDNNIKELIEGSVN